jgi:hypothetical protein
MKTMKTQESNFTFGLNDIDRRRLLDALNDLRSVRFQRYLKSKRDPESTARTHTLASQRIDEIDRLHEIVESL